MSFSFSFSDLFRHFIGLNPALKNAVEEADRINKAKNKGASGSKGNRHRRTEQEEDAELLQDEEVDDSPTTIFTESPACMYHYDQEKKHFYFQTCVATALTIID